MSFGTFTIISYKAKLDAKLVPWGSIGKVIDIWAPTNLHGNGIKGTIFFPGRSSPRSTRFIHEIDAI
jgi:hypothetical protein